MRRRVSRGGRVGGGGDRRRLGVRVGPAAPSFEPRLAPTATTTR